MRRRASARSLRFPSTGLVRAETADEREAVAPGRGRDHARAAQLRELQRERADPARRPVDDHRFPAPHAQRVVDALERRQSGRGHRAGVAEAHSARRAADRALGQRDVLRVEAGATGAELVGLHAIARPDAAHAGSDRGDDSRAVGAEDQRKARLSERPPAGPHVRVPAPDARGVDPDQDVAAADARHGQLADLQHGGRAESGDRRRVHGLGKSRHVGSSGAEKVLAFAESLGVALRRCEGPAFGGQTHISLRTSCTNWTAMAPSPTAEATRLTEPDLTSPAAKTPGRVVSRRNGERFGVQRGDWIRNGPVRTNPFSSRSISDGSQSVRGTAPMKLNRAGCPDRLDFSCPAVLDLDRAEVHVPRHPPYDGGEVQRDVGARLDAPRQVRRHVGVEARLTDDEVHPARHGR
jgi:hypothetical protein